MLILSGNDAGMAGGGTSTLGVAAWGMSAGGYVGDLVGGGS